VTWVGVAGFEPAASSSRSQVASLSASAAARLAWDRPSVDVRWRPPLSVAIVTHFVTRWLVARPRFGEHGRAARQGRRSLTRDGRPGVTGRRRLGRETGAVGIMRGCTGPVTAPCPDAGKQQGGPARHGRDRTAPSGHHRHPHPGRTKVMAKMNEQFARIKEWYEQIREQADFSTEDSDSEDFGLLPWKEWKERRDARIGKTGKGVLRLSPAPGISPVTARTVQGMAPYPGQASCLALGFWPVWPRRLSVKCRREKFVPGGLCLAGQNFRSGRCLMLRAATSQSRGHPRTRARPGLLQLPPAAETFRSVEKWSLSGQCSAIQNRGSASCWASGAVAIVPYRPFSS
jgi:hypothetical protein